ncbi:MAG TPA: hypothetical protein VN673_17575 [Clostridia bacterium]|nr:hypothetical protein [Clostridia bacterium]
MSRLRAFPDELRPCFRPAATLSLLGGEPLLHAEGVLEARRWAKRYRFTCNVSTNGTILSDALSVVYLFRWLSVLALDEL